VRRYAHHYALCQAWHTCIETSVKLGVVGLRVHNLVRHLTLSWQISETRFVVHKLFEVVMHKWLYFL